MLFVASYFVIVIYWLLVIYGIVGYCLLFIVVLLGISCQLLLLLFVIMD